MADQGHKRADSAPGRMLLDISISPPGHQHYTPEWEGSQWSQWKLLFEAKLDDLEQYSRRNSVRISGITENEKGEDIENNITSVLDDMKMSTKITLKDINRVHRIGPRVSLTNKMHSQQIIIQFRDYKTKSAFIKERKTLRTKLLNVYMAEDLTQKRARLFYLTRNMKKQHNILDCWTYDGWIVIKDQHGKIRTVSSEDELNTL